MRPSTHHAPPLPMDVDRYLARIHVRHRAAPTDDYLRELMQRHLTAVPFENLDILQNRPIRLEREGMYRKIVDQRRGGFCYELNGLFAWLLSRLGFNVTLLSARVYHSQTRRFGPEFDHLTLRVRTGSDWLVDVGFGDSARQPISFSGWEATDAFGRFRLEPEPAGWESDTGKKELVPAPDPAYFRLSHWTGEEWRPQYAVSRTPRRLSEFADMCRYHQTSPESPFTAKRICTRATTDGRRTLTGQTRTLTTAAGRQHLELKTADEVREELERGFGISLGAPLTGIELGFNADNVSASGGSGKKIFLR